LKAVVLHIEHSLIALTRISWVVVLDIVIEIDPISTSFFPYAPLFKVLIEKNRVDVLITPGCIRVCCVFPTISFVFGVDRQKTVVV
jgi:hypothetical protein